MTAQRDLCADLLHEWVDDGSLMNAKHVRLHVAMETVRRRSRTLVVFGVLLLLATLVNAILTVWLLWLRLATP